MRDIRTELIDGITEVAQNTGITTKDCIREALKMLEREKKQYAKQTEEQMFKGW